MAYITIVKGDDTDFLDNQYLVVNFNTDIELAGFQAIFQLGNIELTYPDLSAKYIEINLSKEITSSLQKGKMYGTLKLVDTENRIRTITTIIPFNVVTKVLNASQISKQSIQLEVSVNKNEFNVDMNILGLSKRAAENYLTQMKQYDAKLSEKVQTVKTLEASLSKLATETTTAAESAKNWAASDELIDGIDYSAKYYATRAAQSSSSAANALENIEATIEQKASISLDNLTEDGINLIKDISTAGLEIGDIGIAPFGIDESKGLRRYLNGQIIIAEQYKKFTEIIKSRAEIYPNLVCTEEEWQSTLTLSALGQCGRFVIQDEITTPFYAFSTDDITYYTTTLEDNTATDVYDSNFEILGEGSLTSEVLTYSEAEYTRNESSDITQTTPAYIRLPKVVNIQGLFDMTNAGMTIEAGLPNITGSLTTATHSLTGGAIKVNGSGALTVTTATIGTGSFQVQAAAAGYPYAYNINASKSSSVYGNSTTVQPECIQYPYFIQVASSCNVKDEIVNIYELINPYVLLEPKHFETPIYNLSWLLSNDSFNGSKAIHAGAYTALLIELNPDIEIGSTSENGYTKRGLSVKLTTEDYTDYDFVVNTEDETFRLPLKSNIVSSEDNLYLYYYIGEVAQNTSLINAGRIEEQITELKNLNTIKETYQNGTSWYRVWADGWCEQGGQDNSSNTTSSTITFLKPFVNTNYTVTLSRVVDLSSTSIYTPLVRSKSAKSMVINKLTAETAADWTACGYIA